LNIPSVRKDNGKTGRGDLVIKDANLGGNLHVIVDVARHKGMGKAENAVASSSSSDDSDEHEHDQDGHGADAISPAERIKLAVERKAHKRAARRERKRLEEEERIRVKAEAEAQRRQRVMTQFVENAVGDRGSAIQSVRNLDVIPTPFTLHFSRGDDDKVVEMLESPCSGEGQDEASPMGSSSADSQDSEGARVKRMLLWQPWHEFAL
jgi:hypothetical protein